MRIKPDVCSFYLCKNYAQYVAEQKRKGLVRRRWKDLPKMWKEELRFRREFEGAINQTNSSVGK